MNNQPSASKRMGMAEALRDAMRLAMPIRLLALG